MGSHNGFQEIPEHYINTRDQRGKVREEVHMILVDEILECVAIRLVPRLKRLRRAIDLEGNELRLTLVELVNSNKNGS